MGTQKRLNEVYGALKRYIFDCIDGEAYDVKTDTRQAKLQFVMDTFKKEYVFEANLKRYGNIQNVFTEYLAGLPSCINIDFENYKIIELGYEFGLMNKSYRLNKETIEDRFLNNWFKLVSKQFFIQCQLHKVK